jgi:hypothetical protein
MLPTSLAHGVRNSFRLHPMVLPVRPAPKS